MRSSEHRHDSDRRENSLWMWGNGWHPTLTVVEFLEPAPAQTGRAKICKRLSTLHPKDDVILRLRKMGNQWVSSIACSPAWLDSYPQVRYSDKFLYCVRLIWIADQEIFVMDRVVHRFRLTVIVRQMHGERRGPRRGDTMANAGVGPTPCDLLSNDQVSGRDKKCMQLALRVFPRTAKGTRPALASSTQFITNNMHSLPSRSVSRQCTGSHRGRRSTVRVHATSISTNSKVVVKEYGAYTVKGAPRANNEDRWEVKVSQTWTSGCNRACKQTVDLHFRKLTRVISASHTSFSNALCMLTRKIFVAIEDCLVPSRVVFIHSWHNGAVHRYKIHNKNNVVPDKL